MLEYIIPAAAMVAVAVIEAIAAHERKNAKKEKTEVEAATAAAKKREEEHSKAQEEMMLLLIKSTRAHQRGYGGSACVCVNYQTGAKRFFSKTGNPRNVGIRRNSNE